MARSNNKLVPASKEALYRMKYEIAAELGLPVAYSYGDHYGDTEFSGELGMTAGYGNGKMPHDDWGHLTARDAGSVGGEITKRLIAQAEQSFQL